MSQNLLASETSPYLLQHKTNAVHWHPWDDAALSRARAERKPILLSVGYAACHWCHVMAHESFENPEIAALMNENFVNIKVDREERPDIDAIYQSALALMGEHGGWPLTMFLTPEAEPFWGGTYFPPSPRFGRPGFPEVLNAIAETYRDQPEKISKNVSQIKAALQRLSAPSKGGSLSLALLDDVARLAIRMVDPFHGGTVGAPKFPQPSFFGFLWHAARRARSPLLRDAVTVTLDRMCQGGIYDHLGGGFARYSTDETWLVPHFEKMLYDNALLIELMTTVWRETQSPLYATRIRETIDWALRDMTVADAAGAPDTFAFTSAIDADSEGQEGKYYVWSEAEIDGLLGGDAPAFKEAYDVSAYGNWEGSVILNRTARPEMGSEAQESLLAECRGVLLAARAERVPPQRDDKVLADWNGLMISALASAAVTFDEPSWLEAAEAAFGFVCTRMTDGDRLYHSWCRGQARHPAILEDYANLARAALTLFEATGRDDYLQRARSWVAIVDKHYWDPADGGYFMSADDTRDVITRTKSVFDNAVPSGNGTMLDVLARLASITGEESYREKAVELSQVFSSEKPETLVNSSTLLTGFEFLESGVQVVVVGPDPEADALYRAAMASQHPNRIVYRLSDTASLPSSHPAQGKEPVNGAAAAYICRGPVCELPIQDAATLGKALAGA